MRLFDEVKDGDGGTGQPPVDQKSADGKPADGKPADQGKPVDGKPADGKPADGKPVDQGKPAVPEKYEFKSEDGAEVDQEVLGEFTGIAKEVGLTQENASKFYALGQKLIEKQAKSYADHIVATRSKWVEEIKADPVIGGANLNENLSVAKKAISAADTDGKLVKWLNESGAGDNPDLIRAFYRLGKMISDDKLVMQSGRPGTNKDSGQPRTLSYKNSDHK